MVMQGIMQVREDKFDVAWIALIEHHFQAIFFLGDADRVVK